MTQPENEQKLSDGQRLDRLKASSGQTWEEMATDLGVSASMLHSVRRGEKSLGRKPSARLAQMEVFAGCENVNKSEDKAQGDLAGHIVWLEDQLEYARQREDRLLKIIEALASGRSRAAAAPVCGAGGIGVENDKKEKGAG